MADFKIQAGRFAVVIATDGGNHFVAGHTVARLLVQLVILAVQRHQAATMINNDQITVAAQVIRIGDLAGANGANRTYTFVYGANFGRWYLASMSPSDIAN